MDNQKCPQCGAPLSLVNNYNGTTSYKCGYCDYRVDNQPKTISDKIFTFANRIANALSDDPPEEIDARLAAANEKQRQAYEKLQERRIKAYEKVTERRVKYAEKRAERLEKRK